MRGGGGHGNTDNAIMVRQEYSVKFQDAAHLREVAKDEDEEGMDGPARQPSEQSLDGSMELQHQHHHRQHSVLAGKLVSE